MCVFGTTGSIITHADIYSYYTQDSNECGIVCEVVDNFILPPKAEEKVSTHVRDTCSTRKCMC